MIGLMNLQINDAQFFHAIMEDGVINVPNKDNRKEVLR